MYNGTPTLTPLNFLRVNASSVSLFYGSAPWHYYLVQALPLLAGPALPFVLHGAYLALTQGTRSLKLLLYTVIWTGAVFSFAGHKEWRFLHPLVPAMHILASRSLVSLYDRTSPRSSTPTSSLRVKPTHASVLAVLSLAPALYAALWHSSAQISVLSHLRGLSDTELRSVGFLMPCHSTPAQSHLHRRIPIWRLSCEPPLQCVQLSSNVYFLFFTNSCCLSPPTVEKNSARTRTRPTFFSGTPRRFSPRGSLSTSTPRSRLWHVRRTSTRGRVTLCFSVRCYASAAWRMRCVLRAMRRYGMRVMELRRTRGGGRG